MADSIQRTAVSAEDAARAAGETSGAAEDGSKTARLAGEKVKKVFSRIESASQEVFAFGEKTQEISKIVGGTPSRPPVPVSERSLFAAAVSGRSFARMSFPSFLLLLLLGGTPFG